MTEYSEGELKLAAALCLIVHLGRVVTNEQFEKCVERAADCHPSFKAAIQDIMDVFADELRRVAGSNGG
jgi:hypothetical protein